MNVTPFAVHIADEVLEDLAARLDRVRLPPDLGNEDWGYGTNTGYLRELLAYWRDGFDWRQQERLINDVPQFRTTIDGVPIHFVHVRGVGPHPLPIILSHGWPWTFWDYRKLIGPLTDPAAHGGDPADAFDVVVPSLPGFAFSNPLPRTGVSWLDTADMWAVLMRDALGYRRFIAAGADWGTFISSQLGHKYPELVAGVHVTTGQPLNVWNVDRPWDILGRVPVPADGPDRDRVLAWQRRFASHLSVHMLGAQTLANGLHDSPAGLCSWILERRRSWSDCGGDVERRFSKDDLLTTMTLYWATDSFVNSVRYYREATLRRWEPSHDGIPVVGVPTAISVFRPDAVHVPSQEHLSRHYDLGQLRVHDRGGHFAAAEEPEAVIQDLRDGFRDLRSGLAARSAV
jgi:pimeloyl-ACP methyl ester carboxylesterase